MFKALDYGTANPGQDFDENENKLFDPEKGSTDRPMVNLVDASNPGSLVTAPESSRRSNSRPISGDTLGGFTRKSSAGGLGSDEITAAPGSSESPKIQSTRGSNPLPPQESHVSIAGPTNKGTHEKYIKGSGKG